VTSDLASQPKLAQHGQAGGGMVSMHGHGTNSHSLKILPASDGAPRISAEIPAKQLIPIDRREGYPLRWSAKIPIRNCASTDSQAVVGEFISDRKSPGFVSVRTAWRANGKTDGISGCARETLELAFFAENRVESRGRGGGVHASKVKKHHGFVGGMADMTLVISGERG
jgi:hypothetical protein